MDDLEKYGPLLNHKSEEATDDVSDFLGKSGDAKIPFKQSKESLWDKIDSSIKEQGEGNKKLGLPLWRYIGVAASISLVVLFSIFFFKKDSIIEVISSAGERKTELLPDGSKIFINASSSISYHNDEARMVNLKGEAFFEVKKGDRFVVTTEIGEIEVLGTSFNVFSRGSDFEVACKTGKVRVTISSQSISEIITPGEIISFKKDTVKKKEQLPELMGKWQSGSFYFDDQPINEVLEELQRQFSITVESEGVESKRFSGYFTNSNIENALDMICLPLDLTYKRTGQDIFLIQANSN